MTDSIRPPISFPAYGKAFEIAKKGAQSESSQTESQSLTSILGDFASTTVEKIEDAVIATKKVLWTNEVKTIVKIAMGALLTFAVLEGSFYLAKNWSYFSHKPVQRWTETEILTNNTDKMTSAFANSCRNLFSFPEQANDYPFLKQVCLGESDALFPDGKYTIGRLEALLTASPSHPALPALGNELIKYNSVKETVLAALPSSEAFQQPLVPIEALCKEYQAFTSHQEGSIFAPVMKLYNSVVRGSEDLNDICKWGNTTIQKKLEGIEIFKNIASKATGRAIDCFKNPSLCSEKVENYIKEESLTSWGAWGANKVGKIVYNTSLVGIAAVSAAGAVALENGGRFVLRAVGRLFAHR